MDHWSGGTTRQAISEGSGIEACASLEFIRVGDVVCAGWRVPAGGRLSLFARSNSAS